jgi:hypothetical protein
MKKHASLLLVAVLFATLASLVGAAEIVAGPKGGRLLDAPPHHAEFFVTPDRHIEINYYDSEMKPVDHGGHEVAVFVEAPGGKQTLTMQPQTHGFVSREALPDGEPYRVVVRFRTGPQAKPLNYRIDLSLAPCGECQHAEYACTCGH